MAENTTAAIDTTTEDSFAAERAAALGAHVLLHYFVYMRILSIIIGVPITGSLVVYGIITNIFNIIVFHRYGIFSDSCTLSMTALAVSDLLCCIFVGFGVACTYITYNHLFEMLSYPWNVETYNLVLSRIPSLITIQISSIITCYIALERCVAIVFPFKVHVMVSVKRTCIAIPCMVLFALALYLPQSMQNGFVIGIDERNVTSYLISTDYSLVSLEASNTVEICIYLFIRPISIAFVLTCSLIIIWKVNLSQKFKAKATSTSKVNMASSADVKDTECSVPGTKGTASREKKVSKVTKSEQKDRKLQRMIKVLCIVFVICHFVSPILHIFQAILSLDGILVGYSAIFQNLLDFFNATINFNIYYAMSSRYRKEFRKLLRMSEEK